LTEKLQIIVDDFIGKMEETHMPILLGFEELQILPKSDMLSFDLENLIVDWISFNLEGNSNPQ
jgi:hypothetical protein